MKTFKRFSTIVIVLCLALCMILPVFAADDPHGTTATITVTGKGAASSYAGYRLLDLTTSGTGENINYAYTVNSTYRTLLAAILGTDTTYGKTWTQCTTDNEKKGYDKAIVDAIGEMEDDGTAIREFSDALYNGTGSVAGLKSSTYTADITATASSNVATFTPGKQGYYLIAETSTTQPDVYSLVMVDTLGKTNVEIDSKEDLPTVEKTVADGTATDRTTLTYSEAVSAATGETVTFKVEASLPATAVDFADYSAYKLSFIDTMPEHLSYVDNSAKIMYVEKNASDETVVNKDVTSSFTKSGMTFTCNNIKSINVGTGEEEAYVKAGGSFVLTYEATVDTGSVIGGVGEVNTVKINYSASPYDEDEYADSTQDTAQVFGFKLIVNKVDNSTPAVPIAGAKFKLYNGSKAAENLIGQETEATEDEDDNYVAVFQALDEGTYVLEESDTPLGYAQADDVTFTITATYADGTGTNEGKKVISAITTDNTDITVATPADGVLSTAIVNIPGTKLPHTGGRTLVILICAAAVCIIIGFATRKKCEN